jgi:transcriptional regulator with XRE-family HTH domain
MSDDNTDRLVMAARLREARDAADLSQADAAAVLGIPRSGVADFERGLRNVTALEMRRLARLYRQDIAWLVGEVVDSPIDTELEHAMARLMDRDRRSVIQFARFLASQPVHPAGRASL